MNSWTTISTEDVMEFLIDFVGRFNVEVGSSFLRGHFSRLHNFLSGRSSVDVVDVGEYLVLVGGGSELPSVVSKMARDVLGASNVAASDGNTSIDVVVWALQRVYSRIFGRDVRSVLGQSGAVLGFDQDSGRIFVHLLPSAVAGALRECDSLDSRLVREALGFDYHVWERGLGGWRLRVQGDIVIEVLHVVKDNPIRFAGMLVLFEEALARFVEAWYDLYEHGRDVLWQEWNRLSGSGALADRLVESLVRRSSDLTDPDYIGELVMWAYDGFTYNVTPSLLVFEPYRVYDISFETRERGYGPSNEIPSLRPGSPVIGLASESEGLTPREPAYRSLAGLLVASLGPSAEADLTVTLHDKDNIFHFHLEGLIGPLALAIGSIRAKARVDNPGREGRIVVEVYNHRLEFEGIEVRAPVLGQLDRLLLSYLYLQRLAVAETCKEALDPALRLILSRPRTRYFIATSDITVSHEEHGTIRVPVEEPVVIDIYTLYQALS